MARAKKILLILTAILIIILVVLLIYNLFLKGKIPLPGRWGGKFPSGEEGGVEPEIKPGIKEKIKAISQDRVIGPTLSSDGKKVMYYSVDTGNVYESNFDGSELIRTSSDYLSDLIEAKWSSDKEKVITTLVDGKGTVAKFLYDYYSKKSTSFNKFIREIAWSPNGEKIIYQYLNDYTDENKLSIADPTNTAWTNVFETRLRDLVLEWPRDDIISLRTRPSGLATSLLYTLNPATKELKKVLGNIYGLVAKWGPRGEKIVYSATNSEGKNISLFTVNGDGGDKREIDVETLVEKCAWSEDNRNIFCAIPRVIPSDLVMPDDYYKGLFQSSDNFWKINLETGEKKQAVSPLEMKTSYDAHTLFLSPEEEYLFFINKIDGRLYSIEL